MNIHLRFNRRPLRATSLSIATIAALTVTAAGASATGDHPPVAADASTPPAGTQIEAVESSAAEGSNRTAASALAEQFDLTIAQAQDRLDDEHRLDKVSDRLTARLDTSVAGSFIKQRSGDLVVNVLNAKAARVVNRSGAHARLVEHSSQELDRVMQRLNRLSERSDDGAAQGWYVDVPHNRVVVEATKGASDEVTRDFLAKARRSDTVTVERTTGVATAANALYGGQQVAMSRGGTCSLGFNAKDSAGRYVFVTAGHCAVGYSTFSRSGYLIGGTRAYTYPGYDYAVVNNNYPTYWAPKSGVDMYNGYARTVNGWSTAPIGSSVCKSGATTGWTCGVIRAYNQTQNYGAGNVYNLVRHSACVERGDSGGANMSGNWAQGISSGAYLYGTAQRCGSNYGGQPNISWYQPIGQVMSAYNLRLVTPGSP